jgi:DNA-3-methyladenine glycosylase
MIKLQDVLSGDVWDAAPRLLGSYLVRKLNGQHLVGKIVEVEAYDQTDAASHSYHGNTNRTKVTFGPAGYLYVHAMYGIHFCCDITTGVVGHGSSVLVRAVEPLEGKIYMRKLRQITNDTQLANGPAKLCKAFGIDRALNGHNLSADPLRLILNEPMPKSAIAQTARIGISRATDIPWRFFIKGSVHISRSN